MGATSAQASYGDNTLDNGTLDATSQVPQLSVHDGTDINLGYDNESDDNFDLGEYDLTESGDHTLDTTRVEALDSDDTLEFSTEVARDIMDEPGVIRPYEEFDHNESNVDANIDHSNDFIIDDTDIDEDRYDKNFDDDDDDEEWVDISLGE